MITGQKALEGLNQAGLTDEQKSLFLGANAQRFFKL